VNGACGGEEMRTAIEATADGSHDDLDAEQARHEGQDVAVVVINGLDTNDMDSRGAGEEDSGADGLEEEELLAHILCPLCIKEGDGNDDPLCRHEDAQEVEEDLEGRPSWGAEETPGAGGEHESIPGCDGEGADKEVLVGTEMGREVEGGGESSGGHGGIWGKREATDAGLYIPPV